MRRVAGTTAVHRWLRPAWAICLAIGGLTAPAHAEPVEGFTEPYFTIDVAATEPGLLTAVEVQEGQRVTEGQILARLDDDVLQATLVIARELKDSKGQLQSALAEASLKTQRAARIAALRTQGTVSEEEALQADAEKRIAAANVLAAHEALRVKQSEHERVRTQIERRLVRSPIVGVVSEIRRDKGEFVTSIEPTVMTVVQLDPLLAVFSIPVQQVDALATGKSVQVQTEPSASPLAGTIETLSPVANAQSGTVRVKVRLANPEGKIRSGVKCSLLLP